MTQLIICGHLNAVGGVKNVQLNKKLLFLLLVYTDNINSHIDEQKHAFSAKARKWKLEEETTDLKSHSKLLKMDIDAMKEYSHEQALKAENNSNYFCHRRWTDVFTTVCLFVCL